MVGGIVERRRLRMEPDRSRVHGQDEVQCKWSSIPWCPETVPIRITHKKNTEVNGQSTMKNMSKIPKYTERVVVWDGKTTVDVEQHSRSSTFASGTSQIPGYNVQTLVKPSLRLPWKAHPHVWIGQPTRRTRTQWDSMEAPVVPFKRNLHGHPRAGCLWDRKHEEMRPEHKVGSSTNSGVSLRPPEIIGDQHGKLFETTLTWKIIFRTRPVCDAHESTAPYYPWNDLNWSRSRRLYPGLHSTAWLRGSKQWSSTQWVRQSSLITQHMVQEIERLYPADPEPAVAAPVSNLFLSQVAELVPNTLRRLPRLHAR